MKLRAISLNNVRQFTQKVTLDQIGDGLNVLSEPNEHGKSTLFDAIQAIFFKAHGSKDKDIKALQPYAGGAPEITVSVETPEGCFDIAKRWLSKPTATVHQDGRLIAQSDAAEAWVTQLLGGADGGPSGLVWVRQGLSDLASGTKKEFEAGLEARRDLMSSVTGEVEAMTGGRRMDAALARCRDELGVFATGKNRTPRRGGPWKDAIDQVDALDQQHGALTQTAEALHSALDLRKRLRRELAELTDPEAMAARDAKLAQAKQTFETAERHAVSLEAAQRQVETLKLSVQNAQNRLDSLRAAQSEHQESTKELERAQQTRAQAVQAAQAAREAATQAQTALEAAQTALKDAENQRQRAERQEAAKNSAERRADLTTRIAQAEDARAQMEEARAAASLGPDAEAMRHLEALFTQLTSARAARDAAAPQMRMSYAPGAPEVLLNGAPVPEGTALPLHGTAKLTLGHIGTLEFWADDDTSQAQLGKAETRFAAALDALGAKDLAQARTAHETRSTAVQSHFEAQAVLKSLAPDGIAPLRAGLAALSAPQDASDAPSLPDAQAIWQTADQAHSAAQRARETQAERLSVLRSDLAGAEAALSAAQDRATRAAQALSRLGETSIEALQQAQKTAEQALAQAQTALEAQQQHAPDMITARASYDRATSAQERARADIDRLRPELATLDERIERGAGEAVEERLAETEQQLTAARAALSRIAHEVQVLTRLEEALEAARSEARERYFAPIAAELKPLLQLLWPEATLTWGQDTLLPQSLIRNGAEEPIDILSGGTQEQIALLVRLAFARMLAKSGRHAPVILDDALVFTDDDRIERMFDALHRQAGDLQILVLTCRQRAFRDLGGRALQLETRAEAP